MHYPRLTELRPFTVCAAFAALACCLLLATAPAAARSEHGRKGQVETQRYIVLLEAAPLASRVLAAERQQLQRSKAGAGEPEVRVRPDFRSAVAQAELQRFEQDFASWQAGAESALGRKLAPLRRFRYASNGFVSDLSPGEAKRLAKLPGVASVEPDTVHKLHTDAGPRWLGANLIWTGEGALPSKAGEGIVVGVIDSGINWEHPSFADPGQGGGNGYNHQNPLGQQLGLCSDVSVECNDKLIGVYDFVDDDPGTSVVEEYNKGRDNTSHGSLVASVVAGNPQDVIVNGATLEISGVAWKANIISYRVCYLGDEEDSEDDGCQGSAILEAIDRAMVDGVDVINYSLGSGPVSPWDTASAQAMLEAYQAGIFFVSSAGNEGPSEGSMGHPGNVPWVTSVGAASHDRLFGNQLKTTSGGATEPPGDMYGASFTTLAKSGKIVHAKDYGNALCGTGEAELEATCGDNTGASNPFAPGTFNGEIVVCDRGIYGRVEKGKNLLLAGAGGYVLANTELDGESITADAHCLPTTHIGREDGDRLREWLDSGINHQAQITSYDVLYAAHLGDRLSDFSSRGPGLPPVQDVLKPNLLAPGQDILGASGEAQDFMFADGTSFSSPHVAGAAALLLSLNPERTPAQLLSMLSTTATAELATDENGLPATPHERGAGRPRLGEAARAGLYFNETAINFANADPDEGGDPRELNLPSLVDASCTSSCSFTRTVRALVSGKQWVSSTSGFPDGVEVQVTPQQFTLNIGAPRELTFVFDLAAADMVGQWVYGNVHFTAADMPQVTIPVALFASGGALPESWQIMTDRDSGWEDFALSGLTALPQATYVAGGLTEALTTTRNLIEDPTDGDPFDGGAGTMTVLLDVPPGALWLHAETLVSDAEDLDMYMGRDLDGDGQAEESEQLCSSASPTDLESCDFEIPEPGLWWVVVQNWYDGVDNGSPSQNVRLRTVVVGGETEPQLVATGPGIVANQESFNVRLAWEDIEMLPGQTLMGAVAIGTSAASLGDVGVIPVEFTRTGTAEPETLLLANGRPHNLVIGSGATWDRMFVDVPVGNSELELRITTSDATALAALDIKLGRVSFANAFTDAPFIAALEDLLAEAPPKAVLSNPVSSSFLGEKTLRLSGSPVTAGRYLLSVRNNHQQALPLSIVAKLTSNGHKFTRHVGLWEPSSRPGISQGIDYGAAGNINALIWYTYDDFGDPTWYLASGQQQAGNVWTANLLRFTNDGAVQQYTTVGELSVTMLGVNDAIFSWTLSGESGSDRMLPTSAYACQQVDGQPRSYTGLWYRGLDGLGGASVLVNSGYQAFIHYLFDAEGTPRWLLGASVNTSAVMELSQFKGYCALCSGSVSFNSVGVLERGFDSETQGNWTLDYLFDAPLEGDAERSEATFKLTNTLPCN